MAARDKERYYWLKLKRDFFKRHDIRVIEDMPNGKEYVLFYLKLMVEAIDHEGALRFSDTIPYSESMLLQCHQYQCGYCPLRTPALHGAGYGGAAE